MAKWESGGPPTGKQTARGMCLRYQPTLGPGVVAKARGVTSLSEAGRGPLCGLLACLPTCLPSARHPAVCVCVACHLSTVDSTINTSST